MASAPLPRTPGLSHHHHHSTSVARSLRPPSVILRCRSSSACRANSSSSEAATTTSVTTTRRDALVLGLGASALLLAGGAAAPPPAAQAAEDAATAAASPSSPTTYSDPSDGFSLTVPAGWASGEGSLSGNASFSGATGSRRAVAFYDAADPNGDNVVVVVGNTSAEFTKMSSFGTPTTFGSALVNSMDRGFLLRAPAWVRAREAGPGGAVQVARLLDAKETPVPGADGGGTGYLTDYTISQVYPDGAGPPEGAGPTARRLLSVAALHTTPKGYRRILTITAQTTRGDDEGRVAALRAIVESFRIA